MKRWYIVRWTQWDYFENGFNILGAVYESKADAMAEFDRMELSVDVPNVQVWEQLCKNDGFVQAQRRLAIKEF